MGIEELKRGEAMANLRIMEEVNIQERKGLPPPNDRERISTARRESCTVQIK